MYFVPRYLYLSTYLKVSISFGGVEDRLIRL